MFWYIYLGNELTFNVDEKVETIFSQQHFSRFADTISTSEKKRTSRGLHQPFKTMLCPLRRETKRKQHPNFKEYRVGG